MIAYVILAHKGPAQVARLVERLADGQCRLFIHVDRKVDDAPFRAALPAAARLRVQWVRRVDTRWGDYSLVQATLNGLDAVRASGETFSHVLLLSGQSYPIKSNRAIGAFLAAHTRTSFVSCAPMPPEKRCRLERYYFTWRGWRRVYPPHSPARTFKEQFVDAFCRVRFPMPRRQPEYAPPHFGSQWWCLSAEAMEGIRAFLGAHSDYVRFYRYADVPDESFFHSILAAVSKGVDAGRLVSRDLHFTDWDDERRPSPRILTERDWDGLAASDCLFARKFDAAIDSRILDLIDERLLSA